MNRLKLRNILYLLNGEFELYYKGMYVGTFFNNDDPDTRTWLDTDVVSIEGNDYEEDHDKCCVYLTESLGK